MVRLILFDLGDTLERRGRLRPGAMDVLEAIDALGTEEYSTVLLGLASDFDMPAHPSQIETIQDRYYDLLDDLGIRSFFEPVAERVTLSTEVGVFKPDERIFRAAMKKAHRDLEFEDVLFVTENLDHVLATRQMGLSAVHVRGPDQEHGEIDSLVELLPIVEAFIARRPS